MPFPETPRVIYGKNPLVEVLCQVRFPSLLRIETEVPTQFQERIRAEYPLLRETQAISSAQGLPPELAKLAAGLSQATHRVSREFLSADGTWKVLLTRDFLALTTSTYERWEDFRGRLARLMAALREIYEPAFYTRLGLRYKDAIELSALGLEDRPWNVLLRPELAAMLAAEHVRGHVIDAQHSVTLRMPEQDGRVRLLHGLAHNEKSTEVGYLIDADFFTIQRTEVADALGVLDSFNQQAGRLFRWCIGDDLHNAMEPRSPDG